MLNLRLIVKAPHQEGCARVNGYVYVDMFWPTKPNVGEEFQVSEHADLEYVVKKIRHCPAHDRIEVYFEAGNPVELQLLLEWGQNWKRS